MEGWDGRLAGELQISGLKRKVKAAAQIHERHDPAQTVCCA
jgi:hypothetical protein